MFWKKWSKGRKVTAVIGTTALIVVIALIYPHYRNFVDEDNAATCYDARYWVGVRYQQAIRSELQAGADAEDLDYEQILRDVVADNFTFELTEDLTSGDLCRGGGFCTFSIDDETHGVSIDCDQPGHEHYDDADVDDELMDYVTW